MARLKIVQKNPGSTSVMSIKENVHIRKSKRYKKFIIGLSLISILELVIIIYGVIKYVNV